MKQPIELRKLRDFGQIINDSFTFLKENFKPLFKSLFIICGFFILIGIVSTVFTYMNFSTVFKFDMNSYDAQTQPMTYFISAFVSAFIVVLTQAFIHLVTLCYISVYLQKNNTTPTLAEVWGYFRFYFFRVLWSGILIFFIIAVGFVLCIIPGIYLMTVSYLIIPIIVIENSSFSYAFNKSFRLIKNNWWLVFGVIFIMSLIVGIASSIVSMPITLVTVGDKFLPLKGLKLPLIIISSVLRNILLLAYVLPAIAVCLCYFNLSEEKDGTGLLDRIEKIGKDNDEQSPLPAEEF
ncbi:MAG TPA: hypothetical protein DCO83_14265 [Mucilaginibacter sp.]|jgi:hypothetical protein|nr:hypothetical protein [Mucilaginibacter sp.]